MITDIDTVVLAGWHRPDNDLYFAFKGAGASLERIGDAIASRTMMEAVHEGERAARRISAYALTWSDPSPGAAACVLTCRH